VHRWRSSLESLFCYDKAISEERIEKPVGISLAEKVIGDNPRCTGCQAKGAVLCMTCSGSGLYVDSILESQGIIVKVRCLGILPSFSKHPRKLHVYVLRVTFMLFYSWFCFLSQFIWYNIVCSYQIRVNN
jgi:hypothetical protein